MKKFLSAMAALVLLVALVGCAATFLPGSSWKNSTGNITYTFGKDGVLTITTTVAVGGLSTSTNATYDYTVSGDKLYVKSGDTTTEYTVVKTSSSDGTFYIELKDSDGNTQTTLYPITN